MSDADIHITGEFAKILDTRVIHGYITESRVECDDFGRVALYIKIIGEPFPSTVRQAIVDVEIERQGQLHFIVNEFESVKSASRTLLQCLEDAHKILDEEEE